MVEIGVAKAGMERNWAERVLRLGEYPDRMTILDHLFGQLTSNVRHNLPRRPFVRLVGREEELNEVKRPLMPSASNWPTKRRLDHRRSHYLDLN